MPGLGNSELVRLSIPGVNAKTVASTVIATTEDIQRFVPLIVVFELTAATSLTVQPTASIGTNSSTYNNILGATALTGLTTLNSVVIEHLPATAIASVAAGTGIRVNVTVGATGTSGTIRVDVLGYYV